MKKKVWAAAQFESFFNGTWDGGKMNEGGEEDNGGLAVRSFVSAELQCKTIARCNLNPPFMQ